MSHSTVQADLLDFSRCATPDEERLLALYRNSSWEDRQDSLYRLTRLHFTSFFVEKFDKKRNSQDPRYLQEELDEALRGLCPVSHLGELFRSFDTTQFANLFVSAWGAIAPVILGPCEHDGRRTDELYKALLSHCKSEWKGPVRFTRKDALTLIEEWRETVLQHVFMSDEQKNQD